MESVKTIFINSIKDNEKSKDITSFIRDLTFDVSLKRIQNLSNEDSIQTRLSQLFSTFIEALNEADVKNSYTITAVIDGLIKAVSNDKRQYLFKTIYEKEQLETSIHKQSHEIKLLIEKTYNNIQNSVKDGEIQIAQSLNDAKLLNLEMLGILKEAAEEAFITTIEKAYDIKDTVKEISKTFAYQAVNEGKFTKIRVLNAANAIIEAARDIADGDHANADDILSGAIEGVKEGISKAVAQFKNELRFAPDEIKEFLEQEVAENRKDMINMEEAFISMLKQCLANSDGVSAKILARIVAEHNTYIAKLKRLSIETAEVISVKMENFKDDGLKEIREKTEQRFKKIKKDASEKVAVLTTDVAPKAKQIAQDAKHLGFRAWEAAKGVLDDIVKKK